MILSIGVETELEALNGEHKPLLTLQESMPEQADSSCLEFPGMSIVSQSHHRSWVGGIGERRGKMAVQPLMLATNMAGKLEERFSRLVGLQVTIMGHSSCTSRAC
jgi:hypothetical protein